MDPAIEAPHVVFSFGARRAVLVHAPMETIAADLAVVPCHWNCVSGGSVFEMVKRRAGRSFVDALGQLENCASTCM